MHSEKAGSKEMMSSLPQRSGITATMDMILPCRHANRACGGGYQRKLDVAVFCLSLMGENWPDYIAEAKRCLAKNGLLFIAETTKSLVARLSELRNIIKDQSFEIYSDEEETLHLLKQENFSYLDLEYTIPC
jgi:Hypothetical methyltransferase